MADGSVYRTALQKFAERIQKKVKGQWNETDIFQSFANSLRARNIADASHRPPIHCERRSS